VKLKRVTLSMTEVEMGDLTILFSYQTPVACHIQGRGFFRTSEKYSNTTTRHVNTWLKIENASRAEEKPPEWFDSLVKLTNL
jgi:hypothetical protein